MKVFILINAIVFFLYGICFMFSPEQLSLYVTDSIPNSTSGLIDMRATYGGMSLGFGVFLGLISRDKNYLTLGTIASISVVGGMAIGRIIGIIQDGSPNTSMYVYFALEIIVVIIGVVLLKKTEPKA